MSIGNLSESGKVQPQSEQACWRQSSFIQSWFGSYGLSSLPERIDNVLVCPNSNCISHAEPVSSSFAVRKRANDIALKCKYCEKEFSHNVVLAN